MILKRAACPKTTAESAPENAPVTKVLASEDTGTKAGEPTTETSTEADATFKDQEATERWHQRLALNVESPSK
jgi:hypothetical protein